MEEYICKHANPIDFFGQKVIVCEGDFCNGEYKKRIHLDAEPKDLCLIDGMLTEKKLREINLAQRMNYKTSKSTLTLTL